MTTAVLDDFDLDIRIGDTPGRLAVMIRETEAEACSTEIACQTDSGLGCGPVRSQDVCPTDGSCNIRTRCC